MRICIVENCNNKHSSNGLCATHAQRKKKGISLDEPVSNRMYSASHYDRLDKYVQKGGQNECWEWTRSKTKGYGNLAIGNGKYMPAHVAAWERANNTKRPLGMVVRHTCDNRGCCNPEHLEIGTQHDNMQDKVKRGRQLRGENVPTSKLTRSQVDEIRQRYNSGGVYQKQLADEYDTTQSNISFIVSKKTWAS